MNKNTLAGKITRTVMHKWYV